MPDSAKQRSTERQGVGQSGYTAGRVERDQALERQIQDRNAGAPKDADQGPTDVGDDDRFTGRGGRRWTTAEPDDANPKE